ncbi:hypothetical protein [Rhodococcus opacus]|uniref:Ribosome modulation factor n=1 Tax=Rhodococcus opacus (strain B4) TaxID=632772 RepID=C1B9C4_RHOOB|nr:hypothetical protein [Rhodococcus opacus]BAH52277.1 hypothetical protein ROP_40300 [Rhodococcus opacus B4]
MNETQQEADDEQAYELIYDQGKAAFWDGKGVWCHDHHDGSFEQRLWLDGWTEAKRQHDTRAQRTRN